MDDVDMLRRYEVIVDSLEFVGILVGVTVSILVLLRFSHKVGLWMGELKTEVKSVSTILQSGFMRNEQEHVELKRDVREIAGKSSEYGQRISKAEQRIDDQDC